MIKAAIIACCVLCVATAHAQTPIRNSIRIDSHTATYDEHGILQPWTSWSDAIEREMQWYLRCPWENGYPRFVTMTFMNGDYTPQERRDTIPAMQNGMGILSYLKYYHSKPNADPRSLKVAVAMGNFLLKETLTPNTGKYPRFTRSTGRRDQLPLHADSGSESDRPYEIEPDKGAIAAYALMQLYDETKDRRYLDQALQNARVLIANIRPGDALHSPWPFRADYRSGQPRGAVSSDMAYFLRLFDALIRDGHPEFKPPRDLVWAWIKIYQIPSAASSRDGHLWVQFFEDHDSDSNRVSWSPLNMARYLVEQRSAVDADWQPDAKALIDFAIRNFSSIHFGVLACGEQDEDQQPWGGALSNFGAALAEYAAATGDQHYKALAWQALTLALYATDDDGAPHDSVVDQARGGWQEDAHTDKIHNLLDAMAAFPAWAK